MTDRVWGFDPSFDPAESLLLAVGARGEPTLHYFPEAHKLQDVVEETARLIGQETCVVDTSGTGEAYLQALQAAVGEGNRVHGKPLLEWDSSKTRSARDDGWLAWRYSRLVSLAVTAKEKAA